MRLLATRTRPHALTRLGSALLVLIGSIALFALFTGTASAHDSRLARDGGPERAGSGHDVLPVAESSTDWTLYVGGASILLLIAFLVAAGSVMQRGDLAPIGWSAVFGSLLSEASDQGARNRVSDPCNSVRHRARGVEKDLWLPRAPLR